MNVFQQSRKEIKCIESKNYCKNTINGFAAINTEVSQQEYH